MEAFITQGSLYKCFGNSLAWCLSQMRPSPIYRHQWNSLEPWKVPYKSRDSRKAYTTLCTSLCTRDLQNSLESPGLSHAFHHSVEMCGLLQASLELSTLLPLMTKCRSLQKLPGLYISPWEGSFEASCDIKLSLSNLSFGGTCLNHPSRHHFVLERNSPSLTTVGQKL